jgi:ADP-heptose:LPS heptosyltransferase
VVGQDAGAPRRIAVLRATSGLGDLLVIVPALRALRHAYPAATVTLVAAASLAPVAERLGRYVDELFPFPGWPGIPHFQVEPRRALAALGELQARHFDVVFQLHGSGVASNPFATLTGATRVVGYALPGQYRTTGGTFLEFEPREHEVRRALRLLEHVGVPAGGDELEIDVLASDDARAEQLAGDVGLDGPFACVHPGANERERRWPAERFAAVADTLDARGLRVVVTGGARDADATAEVVARARARVIDLTGRTDVGTLAALLRRAEVLVVNDTGVAHLGYAVGVPTATIFVRSDRHRWGPLPSWSGIAVGRPAVFPLDEGSDVGRPLVIDADRDAAARGVTVEEVIDAIETLVSPGDLTASAVE